MSVSLIEQIVRTDLLRQSVDCRAESCRDHRRMMPSQLDDRAAALAIRPEEPTYAMAVDESADAGHERRPSVGWDRARPIADLSRAGWRSAAA